MDGASFPFVKEPAAGPLTAGPLAAGPPAGPSAAWPAAMGWSEEPSAAAASGVPEALALSEGRPNPFAARSVIGYALPSAARVRLAVYDVLGREVAVLVDEGREAGSHEVTLEGRPFPSGTYIVRMEAGEEVLTRRVTVIR